MEEITLKIKGFDRKVSIFLGKEALSSLSGIIKKYGLNKCFILSNERVWQLWGSSLEDRLEELDKTIHIIPDGEKYKNIKTVSQIYEQLALSGATRKTLLISFGGGVVGDLGGFVASTYHRGMPLVHIPTTLLAMVDSSIGGKTGYNLKFGKNLVGTFYQPLFVFTDVAFLKTLPEKEYVSGLAEVIKAALIKDKSLFEYLEENKENILGREEKALLHIVRNAVKIKIKVVEGDEREQGERAILNFGHTLGHAIEKFYNWKILHGEAVAIGMCYAAALSLKKGYLKDDDYERIIKLIGEYGLPTKVRTSFSRFEPFIYQDKKRKDKDVEWVLLKEIGNALWGEKVNYGQFYENYKQSCS